MLTTSTRLKLQSILRRLAAGANVTLTERVYLQKFADCDRTVAAWLRQARRQQLFLRAASAYDASAPAGAGLGAAKHGRWLYRAAMPAGTGNAGW